MSGLNNPILDVACSLDDDYVAACCADQHKIFLYRTKTFNKLTNYVGHSDTINAIKLNYNRKALVSGSLDRTIRQWDMMTGKQISLHATQ